MKYLKKFFSIYKRVFWTREKLARSLGVTIGEGCDIQNVFFGSEPYLIKIGNHVQITDGVKIFTHGAGWVLRDKYPDLDFFGKVEIQDNVYIGSNSLLMPGITIGSNVVIAAGSVVTKSIPNNSVVGGNPARVISSLESFEYKALKFNVGTKGYSIRKKKMYLMSLSDTEFVKK
ncbi:acetyltransferase-like isoleucine patch superfamily enzyme [Pseudoalteromonas sp. MBR-15]